MKFWKEKLEFNKIQKKRLELLEELSPYREPTDPRPILKKVKNMKNKLQKCYVCARKLKEPKYFTVSIQPHFSNQKFQQKYSEFYKICGYDCLEKLFIKKYQELKNKKLRETFEKWALFYDHQISRKFKILNIDELIKKHQKRKND